MLNFRTKNTIFFGMSEFVNYKTQKDKILDDF